MRFVFPLCAICFVAFGQSQPSLFGFLPNSGQFPPAVRFVHYAPNHFSYLTRDSFVLFNGIRVQISNIDPNAQPAGISATSAIYNFYQTQDRSQWITNLHLFNAVQLNNVYPGVSAAFTTIYEGPPTAVTNGMGAVIFSIAAGADPSPIQINVLNTGATPTTGPGGIWFAAPGLGVFIVSAQATQTSAGSGIPITCNWTINSSGALSLQLPNRDPTLETQVVVSFPDQDSITLSANQSFIAAPVEYPTSFGPDGTIPNSTCASPCRKGMVGKLDANGNPLWVTVFGGSGSENAFSETPLPNGVSVTGLTPSPDFPVTLAAPFLAPSSAQDAFLTFFDGASGQLRSSTYAGLPGSALPSQPITNPSGDIALSGSYTSSSGLLGFIALWQPPENAFIYRVLMPAPVVSLAFDSDSNLYFASLTSSTADNVIGAGELDATGKEVGMTANINVSGAQPLVQLLPAGSNGLWVFYSAGRFGLAPLWAARILPLSGQVVTNGMVAQQGLIATAGVTPIGNLKLLVQDSVPTETTTSNAPLVAACPSTSYFVILSPQGQLVYATYVPASGFNFAQQNEPTRPPPATISCIASTAGRVPTLYAAPGEMITITGGGFGPALPLYTAPGSDGTYPLSANGYSAKISGLDAPVFAIANGLIAVQVPFEVSPSTNGVDVVVFDNGQALPSISVRSVPVSFSLFDTGDRNNATGLPALAALNQDGTVNSVDNPATAGSIVSLFGSGAGVLSPPLQTGALSPIPPAGPLSTTPLSEACRECDQILYVGSAPGLTTSAVQINVQLTSQGTGTGVRPIGVSVGLYDFPKGAPPVPPPDPVGVVFVK